MLACGLTQNDVFSKLYPGRATRFDGMDPSSASHACQSTLTPFAHNLPSSDANTSTSRRDVAVACRIVCSKAGRFSVPFSPTSSGVQQRDPRLLSVLPGPTSMHTVGEYSAYSVSAHCRHFTVFSMWSFQYSPVHTLSVSHLPVTFEVVGILTWSEPSYESVRSWLAADRISAEWNGRLTCSFAALIFGSNAASSALSASTASIDPEMTECIGEFAAASHRESACADRSIAASASFSGTDTDSIAPSGTSFVVPTARTAMMFSAQARVICPPSTAATYSPIEWPAITAGTTPIDINRRDTAYSTANSDGWRTTGLLKASLSVPKTKSRMSCLISGFSCSAHSSKWILKVGSRMRPWAMSRYCEPCPGQKNATTGFFAAGFPSHAAAASATRSATASIESAELTATLCLIGYSSRPVRRVCATSAKEADGWRYPFLKNVARSSIVAPRLSLLFAENSSVAGPSAFACTGGSA
eukprot:gene16612-biopygen16751